MADAKISALPSATVPLAGTEVLPIVQSGTTDKVTAADILRQNGQTVTTSNPVLSLAQTWNAGAVTFTGMLFNATNTASAAASLLLDLQVGGTSQFKVSKAGVATALTQFIGPDGSVSAPAFAFAGATDTGFYRDTGGGRIRVAVGGNYALNIASGGIGLVSDTAFIQMGASADTILTRDAANTLALRNGTNAQTFRVYNTFTDSSNYERGSIGWVSNLLTIAAENAGTGSNRGISIVGKGQVILESTLSAVFLKTSGNNRWQVDSSGHFLAAVDNTLDIGASGATRPRSIYVGSNIVTGTQIQAGSFITAGNGTYIGITSSFFMDSASSGVVAIKNWAGTDFNRLQFGGTTSSFPSLKRSTTALHVRLADDSAFANLAANEGDFTGRVAAFSATAIPAGGTAGAGLRVSSTSNFGVFFGSGAPTLSAAQGSLYLRSDGSSTSNRMYVNTDGSTTWTAVTTAA